jgi:hypothetical protein
VSASLQGDGEGDHGVDVTGGAVGGEDDAHGGRGALWAAEARGAGGRRRGERGRVTFR